MSEQLGTEYAVKYLSGRAAEVMPTTPLTISRYDGLYAFSTGGRLSSGDQQKETVLAMNNDGVSLYMANRSLFRQLFDDPDAIKNIPITFLTTRDTESVVGKIILPNQENPQGQKYVAKVTFPYTARKGAEFFTPATDQQRALAWVQKHVDTKLKIHVPIIAATDWQIAPYIPNSISWEDTAIRSYLYKQIQEKRYTSKSTGVDITNRIASHTLLTCFIEEFINSPLFYEAGKIVGDLKRSDIWDVSWEEDLNQNNILIEQSAIGDVFENFVDACEIAGVFDSHNTPEELEAIIQKLAKNIARTQPILRSQILSNSYVIEVIVKKFYHQKDNMLKKTIRKLGF